MTDKKKPPVDGEPEPFDISALLDRFAVPPLDVFSFIEAADVTDKLIEGVEELPRIVLDGFYEPLPIAGWGFELFDPSGAPIARVVFDGYVGATYIPRPGREITDREAATIARLMRILGLVSNDKEEDGDEAQAGQPAPGTG